MPPRTIRYAAVIFYTYIYSIPYALAVGSFITHTASEELFSGACTGSHGGSFFAGRALVVMAAAAAAVVAASINSLIIVLSPF